MAWTLPQFVCRSLLRLLAPPGDLQPYPGWHLSAGVSYRQRRYRWRRALLRQLRGRFVYRWVRGLRVWIDPAREMPRFLYMTGRFEPTELHFLASRLRPGMTFIDVGANAGYYALLAATCVGPTGRVLALEPSPREAADLHQNVQLNRLSQVRIIEAAAHDHAGTATLRIATDANSGHNTLGQFAYAHTVLHEARQVPLVRVDDVVAREQLQRVDVVKLDVEGAEWFALRGMAQTLQRFRPIVMLELSERSLAGQGCTPAQVLELLRGWGYEVRHLDDAGQSAVAMPMASHAAASRAA